jgi:hypothetical protein
MFLTFTIPGITKLKQQLFEFRIVNLGTNEPSVTEIGMNIPDQCSRIKMIDMQSVTSSSVQ